MSSEQQPRHQIEGAQNEQQTPARQDAAEHDAPQREPTPPSDASPTQPPPAPTEPAPPPAPQEHQASAPSSPPAETPAQTPSAEQSGSPPHDQPHERPHEQGAAQPPGEGRGASTPGVPALPESAGRNATPQPLGQSEPSPLSADAQEQMQQAMEAATGEAPQTGGPDAPGAPTAPAPARRPAIRGPRRVESGREHRTGRVVSVGPEDLFLEFGPKELGVAARAQWPAEEAPTVGDSVEVVVDRFDAKEQIFVCSRPGAVQKADWELLEPGQIVEARVTGVNKGGLECEVAKHRAFMPASQVDVRRIEDLSPFVGEKVRCKVKKVDRSGSGNIVLSRRDVVAAEQKEAKKTLKERLEVGQEVEGTVVRIADFGAFVDIGGVDGLVHVSDLSHERVDKVENVVKVGDTVRAKVLKLDWGRDRISLGMKQTEPDPWETAKEQVSAGDEISGRVTKAMDFGAFIEVAPGVEGLCHISELDWKRVPSVEAVVKPGQIVKAKVLDVDEDKKRISLSVKATKEPPPSLKKKQEEQARSAEQIRKETPAQRRMRENFQREQRSKGETAELKSGLGESGGADLGDLGELRLG